MKICSLSKCVQGETVFRGPQTKLRRIGPDSARCRPLRRPRPLTVDHRSVHLPLRFTTPCHAAPRRASQKRRTLLLYVLTRTHFFPVSQIMDRTFCRRYRRAAFFFPFFFYLFPLMEEIDFILPQKLRVRIACPVKLRERCVRPNASSPNRVY